MVAAQSFPTISTASIAGAPVIHETGAGVQLMWSVLSNLGSDGQPILEHDDLPVIHQAAIVHCDDNDGRRDGIIDDPAQCDFDPAKLLCSDNDADDCLTAEQVEVANKIYQGPVDDAGQSLHLGGLMPGSELNWTAYVALTASQRFITGSWPICFATCPTRKTPARVGIPTP